MKKFVHQNAVVAACSGIAAAFVGAVILQNMPAAPLAGNLMMQPATFSSSAFSTIMTSPDSLRGAASSSDAWVPTEQELAEVVAVVETEDGEYVNLTLGELLSPFAGETILEGEVQDGDIPETTSSEGYEYVGTALCSNTSVKRAVNATGRTMKRTYTKGRTTKEIAQRCARSDAESSAQTDGMEAFKNSCGLPPTCQNPTDCSDKGLRFKYEPNPPRVAFRVTEHAADAVMGCPGSKSYSATATVTGDCTSVRYCEAKTTIPRY